MRQIVVASRYAKSLLKLAAEQGNEGAIYEDMKLFVDSCEASHELELLLKSPIVKAHKKIAVLDAIFKGKVDKLSMSFIDTIVKNRREANLYDMAIEYQNQFKTKNGIVTATVTTATGLDAETKLAVLKLVKDSSNSEVELLEKTDSDLIGGLILRIGDEQYDGSLQRRLNDLKQEFGDNKYIAN